MILALAFSSSIAFGQKLPDTQLTPGAVRTTNVAQICGTTTKEYRHTSSALKKQICKEYGVAECPAEGKMEIDHLIPLELGGADVKENLWVQPAPDYHEKDKLENFLHEQVCKKKLDIKTAQDCIRSNWVQCEKKEMGK